MRFPPTKPADATISKAVKFELNLSPKGGDCRPASVAVKPPLSRVQNNFRAAANDLPQFMEIFTVTTANFFSQSRRRYTTWWKTCWPVEAESDPHPASRCVSSVTNGE